MQNPSSTCPRRQQSATEMRTQVEHAATHPAVAEAREDKVKIAGGGETFPQAAAAQQLGLSEGAVKVAIHRLRPFLSAILHCVSPPPAPAAKLRSE